MNNPLPTPGAARAQTTLGANMAAAPAAAQTQVASKPRSQFELFVYALTQRRKSWSETLPKHVSVERFIKAAMIAAVKNPKILQCTEASTFQCLNTAANLGLDVSGEMNGSHLIPFKDKCTLVVGYRDLIGLARRSGQIATINAFPIHEGDEVVVHYGTEAKIEHRPRWQTPGAFLAVYATATLTGGERVFTPIMAKAEIDRIRDASNGYRSAKQYNKSSPWDDHYEEMAKKTALRRLFKILPVAVEEVSRALEASDRAEAGLQPTPAGVKADGSIDVEGFSRMVEDSAAAAESEGAPGAVDAALSRVEGAEGGAS